MADFALLEPPKLISGKNWSDRKIMKFPHCEIAASWIGSNDNVVVKKYGK